MLSIVIPTYNEKSNVHLLMEQIKTALAGITEHEVLFVDDSDDETPQILNELNRVYRNMSYIHRMKEKGLASAVVCGFGMARGDVLAVMDADLQHPPQLLADMYRAIEGGADIVIPSRFIEGGGDEGLSPVRKFTSLAARLAGKMLLKSLCKVSDPTGGFFMLRREVINVEKLRPVGWKILMEVLVMGTYTRVTEVPYSFGKRHADESKISVKATLQYVAHIFSLIARSERERRFYLFLLVGLSGMLIDMLIYRFVSSAWLLHSNTAATISAVCALLSNYMLNRNLTWKSSKKHSRAEVQFFRYACACSTGLLTENLVVYLLRFTTVSDVAANFLRILASGLPIYFLSDKWVFKKKQSDKIHYEIFKPMSGMSAWRHGGSTAL